MPTTTQEKLTSLVWLTKRLVTLFCSFPARNGLPWSKRQYSHDVTALLRCRNSAWASACGLRFLRGQGPSRPCRALLQMPWSGQGRERVAPRFPIGDPQGWPQRPSDGCGRAGKELADPSRASHEQRTQDAEGRQAVAGTRDR